MAQLNSTKICMNCNLNNSDLSGKILINSNLLNSSISNSTLNDAIFRYADLENVELVAISDPDEVALTKQANRFGCTKYTNYQDMIDAVYKCGANAVAAASMFHFTEQTPLEAKAAMEKAGIPVRHPFRLDKR